MKLLWLLITLLLADPLVQAQEEKAVITVDNVRQLQSFRQVEFANLPEGAGEVVNGWFVLSEDGNRLASVNRQNSLLVWNEQGDLLDSYSIEGADSLPNTVLDAVFSPDNQQIVSVHAEGGAYYVAYRSLDEKSTTYFQFRTADLPLRIWLNETVWLEVMMPSTAAEPYVVNLLPRLSSEPLFNKELTDDEQIRLLSGPENDPDSFLRVGRIDPPLAITVTRENLVKRWNLQTGDVTDTVQLEMLPGAGQVNAAGTHFAWRDGESEALHLLDFETGEDRIVAQLEGQYIPFLFLSPAADVIIGVNVALEPVVVAWNTATGERSELGEYRSCNRQPDMVRLSQDGTTLVIGCDTGLDIWRIQAEK